MRRWNAGDADSSRREGERWGGGGRGEKGKKEKREKNLGMMLVVIWWCTCMRCEPSDRPTDHPSVRSVL